MTPPITPDPAAEAVIALREAHPNVSRVLYTMEGCPDSDAIRQADGLLIGDLRALAASPAARAPAAPRLERLRTAAQTVMDAFSSDCVDGERQYPDDPAYNLNDKGKIKLTTGMVWGLRDALDALAAAPAAPPADGGTDGLLKRFDDHRLEVSTRKPSAKRDELLFELDTIRNSMCRALSARTPAGAAGDPVGEALCIVFDGPPGPQGGRFIEVETLDGRSFSAGSWHERPDGYFELRVPTSMPRHVSSASKLMLGLEQALHHAKTGEGARETVFLNGVKSEALEVTRPASPAPAASAGGGALSAEPETGTIAADDRTVEAVIPPALAPAAQVNPGRKEIARIIFAILSGGDADFNDVVFISARIASEKAADAILAARPVADGDAGWPDAQPIETAPKDGTRILLGGCSPGPSVQIAEWGNGRYLGKKQGYEPDWSCGGVYGFNPTCWWPLPTPALAPTTQSVGGTV